MSAVLGSIAAETAQPAKNIDPISPISAPGVQYRSRSSTQFYSDVLSVSLILKGIFVPQKSVFLQA